MTRLGDSRFGLWDDDDEFYYDVLQLPDGRAEPLRVRSIVGLIPLCAVEVLDGHILAALPGFAKRLHWVFEHRPELAQLVSHWFAQSEDERHLLSLLRGHRMKCLLRRMLDPNEFLSEFGIRSLSKYHERHPYEFECGGRQFSVGYVPGDSDSRMFGGNSNWRGPVWMPVNYLIVESLRRFHSYYGDDFRVECPVGSGRMASLAEVADDITGRLCRIFLPDAAGRRPVFGGDPRFAGAEFRDRLLFFEYFHGDDGRGLGASHQTGWSGLVAPLLRMRAGARARAAGGVQPADDRSAAAK
jgi:mannosylglycerate hydrolase MGH1-like protein